LVRVEKVSTSQLAQVKRRKGGKGEERETITNREISALAAYMFCHLTKKGGKREKGRSTRRSISFAPIKHVGCRGAEGGKKRREKRGGKGRRVLRCLHRDLYHDVLAGSRREKKGSMGACFLLGVLQSQSVVRRKKRKKKKKKEDVKVYFQRVHLDDGKGPSPRLFPT